jgi:hypothetical protein
MARDSLTIIGLANLGAFHLGILVLRNGLDQPLTPGLFVWALPWPVLIGLVLLKSHHALGLWPFGRSAT